MWDRATERCLEGSPEDIDRFIEKEEERRRLRIFESLPDETTRAVEMIAGAVAVMVSDKKSLTEDDMLPARLLLFGRSQKPVIRQVGQRWFLSPGGFSEGGSLLLDDDGERPTVAIYDARGEEVRRETLAIGRGTKMTVSGASA